MIFDIRPKYIVFTRTIMKTNEDTLSNVQQIFMNITTTRKQEPRKRNAPERFEGCTNSPTYRHRRTTTENLVGVEQIPNNKLKQAALYEYDNSRLSKLYCIPLLSCSGTHHLQKHKVIPRHTIYTNL